jgi:hypothetical protein
MLMNRQHTLKQIGRELEGIPRKRRVIKALMGVNWWNARRLWIGWRGLRALSRREHSLKTLVRLRTEMPVRCALPNKKQREIGLKPDVAHELQQHQEENMQTAIRRCINV